MGTHTLPTYPSLCYFCLFCYFPFSLFSSWLTLCIFSCPLLQEACLECSMIFLWAVCEKLYPNTMLYVNCLFWDLSLPTGQ